MCTQFFYSCDSFANRLKALRLERDISQEDAAAELNISRKQLGRYESGEQFPTVPRLIQIIAYFEKPFSYFVEMEPALAKLFRGPQENILIPPLTDSRALLQTIADKLAFLEKENAWLKEQLEKYQ